MYLMQVCMPLFKFSFCFPTAGRGLTYASSTPITNYRVFQNVEMQMMRKSASGIMMMATRTLLASGWPCQRPFASAATTPPTTPTQTETGVNCVELIVVAAAAGSRCQTSLVYHKKHLTTISLPSLTVFNTSGYVDHLCFYTFGSGQVQMFDKCSVARP